MTTWNLTQLVPIVLACMLSQSAFRDDHVRPAPRHASTHCRCDASSLRTPTCRRQPPVHNSNPDRDQVVLVRTYDENTPEGEKRSPNLTRVSIKVSEVTIHGQIDCFRIETPTATYLYGKRGAGFASIIDRDGNDWISYSLLDKSRGQYRGMPKCGQPTKYFHAGYGYGQYPNNNPFDSRITISEVGHVQLESETRDGTTACLWDFYRDHATFTLRKIAAPTYWFLYEGTPGGKLDAGSDFVIRPGGETTTLDKPWSQIVPWVCFGAMESPYGLLLINHESPQVGQTDSYVAWPFQREEDGAFQQMTVFGFGRKGYKELIKHVPDLQTLPARFTIAMIDRSDHTSAKEAFTRFSEVSQ